MYEGYPVYTRKASKQNLFFQSEFRGWYYKHRILRWIIGPTVGESSVSKTASYTRIEVERVVLHIISSLS